MGPKPNEHVDPSEKDDTGMSAGEKVEAEIHEPEPETIADLSSKDLERLADEAKQLPEEGEKAEAEEVEEALEEMRVAERQFRCYVKRDGGFRKGLDAKQQKACRRLMKRMGKTQLIWDKNILPI